MHLNDSPLDDLELLDLLLDDDAPPAAPDGATEFRREDGPPPLSRAQRRLWFLQQVDPDSPAYNIFAAVRLSGRLDLSALASALAEIVRRHESLRMSLPAVDGRPEVRVHAAGPFDVPVEEAPPGAVSRLAAEEARRPFDLAAGPLFRLRLLRLAEQEHVALLTLHHSVADGWSMGVFVAELGALYRAFTLGEDSPLPEPAWQYGDYARWQERWLESDAAAEQRRWWLDRLAGLTTLELPTDRPRPTEPSHRGGTHVFQVPDALAASLKALARREGATLYMALLAAFAALLHRYTGQDDIVIGTPVANRHRREVESLIGLFVNSVVLRCDLSGDPGFGEVLRRVRDFVGDALARQDLPFEELVKALAPERETGSNPLFQVMFSLESATLGDGLRLPELTLAPVEADSGVAKFDLLLNFTETATGLSGAFEYSRDLFEPDTIQRMAGHWLTLLSAAVADPSAAVANLPLLTAEELAQLAEWNATATPYPREAGLAGLFEAWVARTPAAIAVQYGAERLTYAELNARADRLAHRLRECGVGLETPVAVHARRSVGMVAGLLGILKAGGYYVPLDPAYPRQRLELMLADCGARVLLTETGLLEQWAPDGLEAICLDRDERAFGGSGLQPTIRPGSRGPKPTPTSGEHLAYVIYTSGSTGTPKGAAVPQRAVGRLVLNCDYAPLRPDDRVAQASNASFDAATFEIWGALLNGARLVGVDQDTVLSPPDFAAFLRARRITTLFLTTALFNQMARETPDAFAPLRHLLFGGEQVDPHWVREVLRHGPPERLLHVYGPTENTTFSTWHRVREVAPDAKTVPIGRAISNTQLHVLDARRQVLPVGVPGELYLAGDGLARGYLGRPDLTDERFVEGFVGRACTHARRHRPSQGTSGMDTCPTYAASSLLTTLYKTGDIVRRLADGGIEFIGRRDSQVKIRGFRIELGEIEAALLRHPEVREAVVLAREDRPGSRRLVAYVALSRSDFSPTPPGPALDRAEARPAALAAFLKQSLPDYMVPASFVFLDSLPLNRNGKIDRQALPAPAEAAEPDAACEPPQGEREQCLATVWRDVLGGPEVGRHDNYFERGGDSITAIQVVSRLRRHGWRARVADVFRHPTVVQLAPRLVAEQSGADAADEAAGSADVPLTPVQRWFFEHYPDGERRHFNQAVLLKSAERLEVAPLRAALDELLRRHDALRLRYAGDGTDGGGRKASFEHPHPNPPSTSLRTGLPEGEGACRVDADTYNAVRQSLVPAGKTADLTVLELPATADVPAELARQADALHASLDLAHGPLLKAGLFRCADADRLLLVVHHLAVDGVSWRILLEELALAYQHGAAGVPIDLGPTTCSFRRWAGALADFAASEELRAEAGYWQALEQADAARLPTRPDGAAGKHGEVESVHASLAPDITAELLGAAHRAFGTEIMDLLLTALGRALKNWSGGAATRITLEGHGREPFDEALDLTRTVGWFTSIYPFLLRVEGDDVGAQIQATKAALRAVPRKGLGYGVLRYLTSDSGAGQGADPQLSFNYLGQFEDGGGSAGLFGFAEESSGRAIGPHLPRAHELDMVCLVSGGRLLATLEFNPAALARATADGVVRDFIAQLETVARHCREVAALGGAADAAADPMPTRSPWAHLPVTGEVEDAYPLSPLQEGFLFQSLLDPDSESYFVQVRFQFAGRLDADAFRDAWYALCRRHAVLRSAFVHRDLARPLQAVLRDRVPDLSFHDLRDMDAEQRRAHIAAYCLDQRRRGFDLEREPLLRVAVFQEGAADHHVVWSYHHILVDGWCLSIVYRDFVELYTARLAGRPARLPPPVPYRRYIDWLENRDSAAARRYWREYLAGYEHLATLPRFGGARDAAAERVLAEETLVFDAAATAGLSKLATKAGATLNAVLRGLWGLVLSRYNDRDEVVFGAIVSGRPAELPGVEEMVGLFISAIPVRVAATPDLPFIDVVRAVRDAALAAESHQYLSLADIQKESVLGGNLFDHMLIFENYPLKAMGGGGADSEARAKFTPVEAYDPTHYDLDLTVTPGEELSVKFTYNTAVYRPDQMRRTAGHLWTAALAVIESPERAVRDIPILPDWERRRLLDDFNATQADYPAERGLVELFEAQAARIPDAPALRCGDFTASYRELNAAANRLAHRLRASGVAPGTAVGLCVGRTPAMIVGPLAIMKAGGVFVPLDPDYPRERLAFMVEDAGIAVLLADEEVVSRPTRFSKPSRPLPSIPLNADGGTDGEWPADNPPRRAGPADTAYLIYTSGSTGRPKGVAVAHRSLANMAQAWRTAYRLDDFPVRLLQLASLSFDVFVGDLVRALTNGGTLVVCPADAQIDPPSLYGLLVENGISLFESTPGVVLPLMEYVHRHGLALDELRLLIVGSDSLPARHFQTLVERFGSRFRIVNSYGVTEATIDSSFFESDGGAGLDLAANTPIGKPLSNTRFYVLDRRGRPQPIGVPGELYIGGDGVAQGYLNRPELTAERFVSVGRAGISMPDIAFSSEASGMGTCPTYDVLYRTGDLARWLPDGNMEFLGRIDSQVKVRGYRIELGEIEDQLLRFDPVEQAVVLARDIGGGKDLAAYVVADGRWDVGRAREFLRGALPAYMVPAFFVRLERFPLTPNGKIDRRALPDPLAAAERTAGWVPPRDAAEAALVEIWREVLQVAEIGVLDNFFELGGHSLKAMQIVGLIHKRFGVEVPLRQVFVRPTVAGQAELVADSARSDWSHIAPAPRQDHYELSYAQRRLWLLDQLDHSAAYNMPEAHLIRADIDGAVLNRAFRGLIQRHESLCTAFAVIDDEPRQVIRAEVPFAIAEFDLRASPDPDRESREIVDRDAGLPFDLAEPPLLRVSLAHLPGGRSLFALTMHHIVGDGWSGNIVLRELLSLYDAYRQGKPDPLKPLRIQYKDYAAWQHARGFEGQERYWLERLAGMAPGIPLPYDFPPGEEHPPSAGLESLDLAADTVAGLRRIAARRGATLSNVLLGVFELFLSHWTGQDDLTIGLSVANRGHPDLENLIGFFVNLLPIRCRLSAEMEFGELLEQVAGRVQEALERQDYPFDLLVQKLNPARQSHRQPLVNVIYAYQNFTDLHVAIAGEGAAPAEQGDAPPIEWTGLELSQQTAKYDLTLVAQEEGAGLRLALEYDGGLFLAATIREQLHTLADFADMVAGWMDP